MRANDLKRTGANVSETILTPANVTAATFGRLSCKAVDGEIYAQILYVPGVDFGAKGKHNVIVVATMRNHIYVIDADDGNTVLWDKAYGMPVGPASALATEGTLATCAPYLDISQWVGILSTPAIDPATGTIYFVARTSAGGTHVQKLYAESLIDGSDRPGSPVTITATYQGTGDQISGIKDPAMNGTFRFDPKRHNQRVALTLHDGLVYIAWSAFCDFGPYHGWLIGYDAKTLAQSVVYNTSPNGRFAGIWMSGSGPAIDDDGTMYLATGNGTADLNGGLNHGQSLLKLRRQGNTMQVVDWFIPFGYDYLEASDRDLGSAGVVLVPGTNLLLGGGKEGKLYVANKNDLGKFTPPTVKYQASQPMAVPPRPTVYPVGTDRVVQTITLSELTTPAPAAGAGRAHNHSTPVYWKSAGGEFIYTMAEEDFLKQFRVVNGKLELFKMSQIRAPDDRMEQGYAMPGGTMSLSANGTKDGIVWVTMPINRNANNAVVPGVMYAFDASDVSKPPLWNSETSAADSLTNYAKFNPVTVYNGKVYVPTFKDANGANQYCTYGRK
jgi:hypothetical protein